MIVWDQPVALHGLNTPVIAPIVYPIPGSPIVILSVKENTVSHLNQY